METEKSFVKCDICGDLVSDTLDEMRDHIELHHAQARHFSAEQVMESFTSLG